MKTVTVPITFKRTFEHDKGGSIHLKISDCCADIEDNKHKLGSVSGCIGGAYEVVIENGDHYSVEPLHVWNQLISALKNREVKPSATSNTESFQ